MHVKTRPGTARRVLEISDIVSSKSGELRRPPLRTCVATGRGWPTVLLCLHCVPLSSFSSSCSFPSRTLPSCHGPCWAGGHVCPEADDSFEPRTREPAWGLQPFPNIPDRRQNEEFQSAFSLVPPGGDASSFSRLSSPCAVPNVVSRPTAWPWTSDHPPPQTTYPPTSVPGPYNPYYLDNQGKHSEVV